MELNALRVYDRTGKVIVEVDGELLKDFFDEVFIEEKSLVHTLIDYKPEVRKVLSEYIIYRLAEVNPAYLPEATYD